MEEIDERKEQDLNVANEENDFCEVEQVKDDKKKDPPRTGGGTGSLD